MTSIDEPAASSERDRGDERSKQLTSAGTFAEAFAGLCAVVLAILGLIGIMPVDLAAIGIIVVSAALLLEGVSIAARVYRAQISRGVSEMDLPEIAGGLGAESFAALAGLALGLLALLGVDSMVLMPAAAIVLGVGMMFGSAATARMNSIRIVGPGTSEMSGRVAREAVRAASSAHLLVGLAVVVFGIVGLAVASTVQLTLVSVLCLGGVLFLSGAAIGGRLMDTLHSLRMV